jgi:hypothetical protein
MTTRSQFQAILPFDEQSDMVTLLKKGETSTDPEIHTAWVRAAEAMASYANDLSLVSQSVDAESDSAEFQGALLNAHHRLNLASAKVSAAMAELVRLAV